MKIHQYFFILLSTFFLNIYADRLTIHNRTPRDLYVAVYYMGMKLPWEKEYPKAKLATPVQFLEYESSGIMQRPARKVGYDRELVFVDVNDKDLLKPELTKEELEKYHAKNVGDLQGDVFYIGDEEAEFYGYTTIEWNVNKPILQAAQDKMRQWLSLPESPYAGRVATVRIGNELCQQEKNFLTQRKKYSKQALEQLLGYPLKDNLTISIVASGGSSRAFLYVLGALTALEDAKLLDGVTYISALSGSTGLGAFISSGKSLADYKIWLLGRLDQGIKNVSPIDTTLIAQMLISKYFNDQPLGTVDLFGALLANMFCGYDPLKKQRLYISDQARYFETGKFPLLFYTAVRAESSQVQNQWYELSAFELSAPWMEMSIDTWAMGRKFKNGKSVNNAPELSLGNILGICWFIPSINIQRILQEADLERKMPLQFAKNIVKHIDEKLGEVRFVSAEIINFTYQMEKSPVKNAPLLRVTDAGASYSNLSYPPVSGYRKERTSDLLLLVDASAHLLTIDPQDPKGPRVSELKLCEKYARQHGLPFPAIPSDQMPDAVVSLFKENDPKIPVVIYQPRISDQKALKELAARNPALREKIKLVENFDMEQCIDADGCTTKNISYSPKVARQVMLLGELNMYIALDAIKKGIEHLVDVKKLK